MKIKKSQRIIILSIILLFLMGFFGYKAWGMITHYAGWKDHHTYMKSDDKEIQPWMTANIIARNFDKEVVDILKILGVSNTLKERKKSLDQHCEERDLNCREIIKQIQND